jgi:hypothetical protein
VSVELRSDTFAPHVGDTFQLTPPEGEPFEAVLTECEVTRYGDHEKWLESIGRVPFSLVFRAPGGELVPQANFELRHDGLGDFALFLVPLGPGPEGGMRYEAVVS